MLLPMALDVISGSALIINVMQGRLFSRESQKASMISHAKVLGL